MNTPLSTEAIALDPGHVTLAQLRRIHAGGVLLTLDPSAQAGMQAALATVQRIVDEDQVVYGINTGFGKRVCTIRLHLKSRCRRLAAEHPILLPLPCR